jgi:hypothetical protein
MSYVAKLLLPNEKVVGVAVLHWIIYLNGLRYTIFGGVIGAFSFGITEYLFGTHLAEEYARPVTIVAAIIVLYGIFVLLCAFIRQTTTELVMTDHRLITKYGIIARSTYEIMASRITGANFQQSILGRILNFGTIWIHGASGEVWPIYHVYDPQGFYRAMVGVLERFQPTVNNR